MRRSFPRLFFKKLLLCAIVILLAAPAAVLAQRMANFDIGQSDFIPPPRLILPSGDVVDITGKDALEFKWSPHEGDQVKRDYYDFRLYRGRNMLQSTLVLKMRIPPRQWSVSLKADIFKDGEVYTWSLRQFYTGSVRSRRSFESFKVINKR